MSRRFLPRALGPAISNFVLAPGEVVYDQDAEVLRIGNGTTPGGRLLGSNLDIAVIEQLLSLFLDNLPIDPPSASNKWWNNSGILTRTP